MVMWESSPLKTTKTPTWEVRYGKSQRYHTEVQNTDRKDKPNGDAIYKIRYDSKKNITTHQTNKTN